MKLQYLGDSKDSFKWDYHDYLTNALKCPTLQIIFMMTTDDNSDDGKTKPERFPAREQVIDFCKSLRMQKNINLLYDLPNYTNSQYSIKLHKPKMYLTNHNRDDYFSDIIDKGDQVLFMDPDNGFEPEKSFSAKHLLYSELLELLDKISANSVISVFHHFRRISFMKDFMQIKQRIFILNP